mmetsp:Transcript_117328/g.228117  ORF Transcript_117328/g.228117 Transcript_117328/m.228117 type:complete len:348 (+) Transcript_117328:140-1183(+)
MVLAPQQAPQCQEHDRRQKQRESNNCWASALPTDPLAEAFIGSIPGTDSIAANDSEEAGDVFADNFGHMQVQERKQAAQTAAWAAVAVLPCPPQRAEFIIHRLPATDQVAVLFSQLVKGTCLPHRRGPSSKDLCPAPQLQIHQVDIVANPCLARLYHSRADELETHRNNGCSTIPELARLKLPSPGTSYGRWPRRDLNEHLLFHGASGSAIEDICRNGFDPRRGGESSGRLFGLATYLAANASKSDIYTDTPDNRLPKHDVRRLIIARALLGESHRAVAPTRSATRPPDGSNGQPLDSVWADVRARGGAVDHLEVMVYDRAQIYPEAIISYSHSQMCACALCGRRPG